jgi:hypothetical protein
MSFAFSLFVSTDILKFSHSDLMRDETYPDELAIFVTVQQHNYVLISSLQKPDM